jgi:hypothetical protein
MQKTRAAAFLRFGLGLFGFGLFGLGPALLAQAPVQTRSLPKIGTIDFYGLHKVTEANLRKTLGFREGDPLPPSKGDIEAKLDALPGVTASHLEAVCCENGGVILYVGIEEKGAPHFELHPAPEGDAMLPEEVAGAYRRFLDAFDTAARLGVTGEDLTKGYARSADATVRAVQDMFPRRIRPGHRGVRAGVSAGPESGGDGSAIRAAGCRSGSAD